MISAENYAPAMNYYEAAEKCNSFGAKLISASDVTLDSCAAYAIDMGAAFDQMVLYSGRYLYGVSTWVWCSGDRCDSGFDYSAFKSVVPLLCKSEYLFDRFSKK